MLERRFAVQSPSKNPAGQVNEEVLRVELFNTIVIIQWKFETGIDPNLVRRGPSATTEHGERPKF